jgi:hypothetical protein
VYNIDTEEVLVYKTYTCARTLIEMGLGLYMCLYIVYAGWVYVYLVCTLISIIYLLLHVSRKETAAMPGRGGKGGAGLKPKKHFKAKQQKKRVFRSKDPSLAVLMWGVQHSVSNLSYMYMYIVYM